MKSRRLETRLLHYFLLITLAAMMIGVEFYFEMTRTGVQETICSLFQTGGDGLERLRIKVVIMFGVLTLVVAIVLMMFIRNITQPLQRMADITARINQGDLSLTVEVNTHDEIEVVANTINDLTSNLQEVAAFSATTAREIQTQLDAMQEALAAGQTPTPEAFEAIGQNLESLQMFVDSFTFLGK